MSDGEAAEFRVEVATVEFVRPLRGKYLRPGKPEAAVEYDSDDDASAVHFVVRDQDGIVIGVASLHDENRVAGQPPYRTPGVRLRGLTVDGAWRRKGVGAALVGHMVQVARERGANELWANAREMSVGLLERHGFRPLSAEFEIPSIGTHWVMARRI